MPPTVAPGLLSQRLPYPLAEYTVTVFRRPEHETTFMTPPASHSLADSWKLTHALTVFSFLNAARSPCSRFFVLAPVR